jgi:hypothetical protein
MSQSERVQISVYLPKEVHEALVKWAEDEDRSVKVDCLFESILISNILRLENLEGLHF